MALRSNTLPSRAAAISFGREVLTVVRATEVTFLAAAIAYYAFVSVVPLLLLLFVVASTLAGDAFATEVVAATRSLLTPSGQSLVVQAVESEQGRGGATVAGGLVLLWSSLKLFRGFDTAFSRIYQTTGEETLPRQLLDALVVLTGSFLAVVAMVLVTTVVSLLPQTGVTHLLASGLLALALTVVFLPMYYVFPDVETTLRETVPGAVVAALGWTVLEAGFTIYAANAGQFSAYGVIGGVLVVLTWFYVAATLVLVGGVVNFALARTEVEDAVVN
jgi:YihY family inner membrane protein